MYQVLITVGTGTDLTVAASRRDATARDRDISSAWRRVRDTYD